MRKLPDSRWWPIGLVLTAAAALRLIGIDYSFSNDELSALSRLTFDNFGDLIRMGVMPDFHPALVQFILYFWTALLPETEFFVRVPFVLFGVGSILMVYLVGRQWFSENAALLAAAAMAGLQFFIMYSQLARPYAVGLFFTWWMLLHWTRILRGRSTWLDAIFGGLATALAMYTHYFSFMQVMLAALLGLIWIRQSNWRHYLGAGALALLLWIPHLPITMHHLSKGGVGTWLGPPEPDFIFTFLVFVFNDAVGVVIIFILTALVGWTLSNARIQLSRWHLVALSLFLLPFLIGYFYSRQINPVLQYSTLLFATPGTLLALFSAFGKSMGKRLARLFAGFVLLVSALSTAVVARYYTTENFGVFRELAEAVVGWENNFGKDAVLTIANLNSPGYLQHYFERMDHPVRLPVYEVESDSNLAELQRVIQSSEAPYLAFAWSTRYVPFEAYEIIRKTYPTCIAAADHFNSGAYLFSRKGIDERKPIYHASALHGESVDEFERDENKLVSAGGQTTYRMLAGDAYALTWQHSAAAISANPNHLLVAEAKVRCPAQTQLTLVFEHTPEEGSKSWYGKDLFPAFAIPNDSIHHLIVARTLPPDIQPDDLLKIYLWKRSATDVQVDDLQITLYQEALPKASRPPK